MAAGTKGNCYLCGATLGKAAMKNHIFKAHNDPEGGERHYFLKIEGAYSKGYWLYIDVPVTEELWAVDEFLRAIWLECCDHLSAFYARGSVEIPKECKLSDFSVGEKLFHQYDFGTTTETIITIVGEMMCEERATSVRLLARNVPPTFTCESCGEPATMICTECMYDSPNPFFCDACAEEHEHEDMLLPVTNSPRMGECGYSGELDHYEFDL